jgi:MFS family permease
MWHLNRRTQRVLASHAVASLALSLPWPLLLVLVAERSEDPLLLGLAGGARMLPYVVLSWAAGRLADAMRRDLIVRATLVARSVLFLAAGVAVLGDRVWPAVGLCTLAVAVATPAYPALVAAMPGVAGGQRRPATELLVTVEVAAFVVGASLGGLLLHPATRDLVPWIPVVMTLVATALVLPVAMPRPVRDREQGRRSSAYAVLRRAPAARRAIAVMAVVNLVISLVALALLPLAVHRWSSDAAGYGLAAGVFGLAALGAPLLRRLGDAPSQSMRRGLPVFSLGLVLVVPAPSVGWALAPLVLAGAAAVSVEAAATGVLQETVSDEVRATVLGINDSVIIGAALVGSLVAPLAVELLGGSLVLAGVGVLVLTVAWWARPQPQAVRHSVAPATAQPARR